MNSSDDPTKKTLVQIIQKLRENPDKYNKLRESLKSTKDDEEKAVQLINFATNERELTALIPNKVGDAQAAAWTTVTVTTIFIADSAYWSKDKSF